MTNQELSSGRFRALGVPLDAVQLPDVIQRMEMWISHRDASRYVAITNAHGVVEALHDDAFKQALESADMVVPDGAPLVWFGRRNGFVMLHGGCGQDLFGAFCRETYAKGYYHYLYGGAPGATEALAEVLIQKFPGVRIAGMCTPPFRQLTPNEDQQVVEMINRSGADVLWVGLGCPEQERWMCDHRDRLTVPVVVGVGPALDFLSGRLPRAPRAMGIFGLEWLYRFWREPRRLMRRTLISHSSFFYYFFREVVRESLFSR